VQPIEQPPHGDYWTEGVHFNDSGWRKMASAWYGAMIPVVTSIISGADGAHRNSSDSAGGLKGGNRSSDVWVHNRARQNISDVALASQLMVVGDSLVVGEHGNYGRGSRASSLGNEGTGGGFRTPLGLCLKPKGDAGSYHRQVDFVGMQQDFGEHQGYVGATLSEIEQNMSASQAMLVYQPRTVLVLGGTFDLLKGGTAAAALRDAASLMRTIQTSVTFSGEDAPVLVVLWSTLPPVMGASVELARSIDAFNTGLPVVRAPPPPTSWHLACSSLHFFLFLLASRLLDGYTLHDATFTHATCIGTYRLLWFGGVIPRQALAAATDGVAAAAAAAAAPTATTRSHMRLQIVNMSAVAFEPDDYWPGGVSFNSSGWSKMAHAWFEAWNTTVPDCSSSRRCTHEKQRNNTINNSVKAYAVTAYVGRGAVR
jgi:hypothetical protein